MRVMMVMAMVIIMVMLLLDESVDGDPGLLMMDTLMVQTMAMTMAMIDA